MAAESMNRALDLIEESLQEVMLSNRLRYGRTFVAPEENPFPASEKMAETRDYLQNATLEQNNQVSVMYHEILSDRYPGRGIDLRASMLGRDGRILLMGQNSKSMTSVLHVKSEDDSSAAHKHNYIEMIYVHSGRMTERIEDTRYTFREKQVCLLNRNCSHRDLRFESEGIAFYVNIRPSTLSDLFMQNIRPGAIRDFLMDSLRNKQKSSYLSLSLDENGAAYAEECLGSIICELYEGREGYGQMVQVYLMRMLNAMNRTEDSKQVSVTQTTRDKLMYQVLMSFIDRNLSTVNLQLLCDTFHYQKDYYNRLIQKYTGMTFAAYVQHQRLERAKDLLFVTELPAGDIGLRVGYKNPSYFFRVFKENCGQTPQEYRISSR